MNELFIEGKVHLCISKALMAEYYDVLRRPKFASYYDFMVRAELLLTVIETKAVMYTPSISLNIMSDKDDNVVLELAEVSEADYIITGNTIDFTFPSYKSTQIVTPKEYWLNFEET